MLRIGLLAFLPVFLTLTSAVAQNRQGIVAESGRRQIQAAAETVDPSAITVGRLHYGGGGDWYWGSSAVPNFLKFVRENSNFPVDTIEKIVKVMDDNLNSHQEKVADLPLDVFDYQKAVKDWTISYVACRDSELIPKFANDPAFSLVFINDEVAIFMVKRSFNQVGRTPSS